MGKQPRSLDIIAKLRLALRRHFQTKILLVAVGGAMLGILSTATVSFIGLNKLADDASTEIEAALNVTSQEYLEQLIEDTAGRVNLWMGHGQADLLILADITQKLIDHREEFRPLTEAVSQIPFFEDKMRYYPEGRYSQNAPEEPTVVTVQALLHDEDFQVKPYPQQIIDETAILDLVMPAIHTYGANKTWTYFVGHEGADFLRIAPWVNFGQEAIAVYPEHMDVSYWSFFPGLVGIWEERLKHSDSAGRGPADIIAIPPAVDSASGTTIQIFGHPLWNRERTQFAGAVWYDLALGEITEFIEEIKLAETGFAFLALADGNIIAIPEGGIQTMGLREYVVGDGHLRRNLEDSRERDIATLTLPLDDDVSSLEVQLSGKEYILMMRRLAPVNTFEDDAENTRLEHWTLGFVVPKDEILAPLVATQQSVDRSSKGILFGQILVLIVTILVLISMVYFVTGRMTADLVTLSDSTHQIMQGNYDTGVTIQSEDEIGQLGRDFKEMAHQLQRSFERVEKRNLELRQEVHSRQQAEEALQEYSERLEEMVEERTQELRDAQEQLVRQEKLAMLGQLAGGVAHELRNPLGVLSNAAYYLKMTLSDVDATTGEYLEIISSEVRNAQQIVSDLLDFSRTRLSAREEIALSALVTQVLEKHPPPKKIHVTTEIASDLPPVFVDPQQIDQVLVNLVTNAYQAMSGEGRLTISAQIVENKVALSVSDTGSGISQENMAKIFEPLFTTKARGIGLGLALSKKLVESNGGSIEVESEEGKGSTFTVKL
jgi:sigma-B regulation protein RsbU (phosphoserine phosphatase)